MNYKAYPLQSSRVSLNTLSKRVCTGDGANTELEGEARLLWSAYGTGIIAYPYSTAVQYTVPYLLISNIFICALQLTYLARLLLFSKIALRSTAVTVLSQAQSYRTRVLVTVHRVPGLADVGKRNMSCILWGQYFI